MISLVSLNRRLVLFVALAGSLYHGPTVWGAPPSLTTGRAISEEILITEEALPQGLASLLSHGMELESQSRWSDALAHYEEAIRQHPTDRRLQQRFAVARMHFSLSKRYRDPSFVSAVRSLNHQEARDLYDEVLRKIETHYVVTPPWVQTAKRGISAIRIASGDAEFLRKNGVHASSDKVARLHRELKRLLDTHPHNAREDLLQFQEEAARIGAHRIGLNPVATALEFTAAAADGLDRYSSFLTPARLREVYSQIEGNFVGLGVELKSDKGALLIVRVIPKSPADRAGIRPGDRIVAVDDQATSELATDAAAEMLTGEEGSMVRVTVVSPRTREHLTARPVDGRLVSWAGSPAISRELVVTRAHVDVPALEEVKIIDSQYGVAYLRVPVFQKTTSRDLDEALWDLHRQGMRSLVLDLRGNPGGLLTSSVEVADKFVAQGNLVSTRGRGEGEDFDYRAHRAGTWRVPLVVLIDGDSASASEIFAAAIHDNRRGTIVGERSFGKGSVQGIFPLGFSGAGVRLTTAKFFSPSGQPISKVGVSPDIVVRHAKGLAEDDRAAELVGVNPSDQDSALRRAIEAARRQVALR